MILLRVFLVCICLTFAIAEEEVSSPLDWNKVERVGTEAVTNVGSGIKSFAEKEIAMYQAQGEAYAAQLELIAGEMNALEGVLPKDFSFDMISNVNLSNLDAASISGLLGGVDLSGVNMEQLQGLGTLAGIEGLENLDYLSSIGGIDFSSFTLSDLGSVNFSDFSLDSIGELGDFSFDMDSLFTFDSISSITESLGFGGQAKGSLQNLVALESQMVRQDSGQTMHHAIQTGIYREYLLLWKQLNFVQRNRVSLTAAEPH